MKIILHFRGISSADWQQQMRTSPTQFHTSDHRSDGLDSTTDYIRPLPSIPDCNPYYIDPDYGIDRYWDIQLYNKHELQFYSKSTKPDADIKPDCLATDRALNDVLTKAPVDACQTKIDPCALSAQDEQEDQFCNIEPRVFFWAVRLQGYSMAEYHIIF